MPVVSVPDELVLRSLVALALANPERRLFQFRSLVGACQYAVVYRAFRRWVPRGAEVLDWGAGNGHFSYFLLRSGYRPTGYALGESDLASWLADDRYALVRGSLDEPTRLPFADGRFDAVASVGVLEHVRETGSTERASLREIARVLRPGGVFLCAHFPNRYSLVETVAGFLPSKPEHAHRYTVGQIHELLDGVGLGLVERRRYGVLPRNCWGELPRAWGGSRALSKGWNLLDQALGAVAAPICQNHLFVARRLEP